jgi:hypothetical protein
MGVKLVGPPIHYTYRKAVGTSGCYYEGRTSNYSKDKNYGYVILTPVEAYSDQPLFQNEDVSGIGDGAYFNRGSDTRQLWVKVDNKVAFVIGFGDEPNEEGAKAIAKLLVEAIQ